MRKTEPPVKLAYAVFYYGACSSLLLVVNKIAIAALPAPVALLALQFWFSALVTLACRRCGLMPTDTLTIKDATAFVPVVVSFLGTVFTNIKVLQHTNVETFITFRSSTPIVLSICDYLFLGRTLPNARSMVCLVMLAVSSAGYAMFDSAFKPQAYAWLAGWFVSFTVYEVVVKHLCDTLVMSNWTRVLYTNLMAGSVLLLVLPLLTKEHAVLSIVAWRRPSISMPVAVSCMIGLCVTHAVYVLRCAASATLSAVVGILCKVVSVMISYVVWDKPVTTIELVFLALGLAAGAFYQQAPLRQDLVMERDSSGRTEEGEGLCGTKK